MFRQPLRQNTVLRGNLGSYVIDDVIGHGGFGTIYCASTSGRGLPEKVAVKEFFPRDICSRSDDPEAPDLIIDSPENFDTVRRLYHNFQSETRNLEMCAHPGIVRVYESFESNGTAYIVEELIEGETLRDVIDRLAARDAMMSYRNAVDVMRQLADAVDSLHELSINHLDIKPGNIMLTPQGRAVLIDFGHSRRFDGTHGKASDGMKGASEGYAPIEQYQGIDNFSPETDVYALGATFYRLLTGIRPPSAQLLARNPGALKFPNGTPDNAILAIRAAMLPDRSMRLRSAPDFIDVIDEGRYALPSATRKALKRLEKAYTHEPENATYEHDRIRELPDFETEKKPAPLRLNDIEVSENFDNHQRPHKEWQPSKTFVNLLLAAVIAFSGYIAYLTFGTETTDYNALFTLSVGRTRAWLGICIIASCVGMALRPYAIKKFLALVSATGAAILALNTL